MTDELRRLLERLAQKRIALEREGAAARARARCAAAPLGCALERGARVFDPQTGLEGEVLDGTRENIIIPAAVRRDG